MSRTEELALALARRQKRLKYWAGQFSGPDLTEEEKREIEGLFTTYRLLISKLAQPLAPEERKDCELRIESIERDLTSLFEARRLLTSEIGAPAIVDLPH